MDDVSVPAEIATEGHKITVQARISEQAMAAARAAGIGGEPGRLTPLAVQRPGAAALNEKAES